MIYEYWIMNYDANAKQKTRSEQTENFVYVQNTDARMRI